MSDSHEFGAKAEAFAADFLVSKGYCILHRNWTYGHKELDIVCTDGKMLVVVEVKARQQAFFPHPEDLLSPVKEKFILEASEQYLFRFGVHLPVRFDLISVIKRGAMLDAEHFIDAIIPGVE